MQNTGPGAEGATGATGTSNWQHRWEPFRKEWVLIAAHVGDRPWSGAKALAGEFDTVAHDPACYLCPGNARAKGDRNPPYTGVFTFENDFASWSNLCPPAEPGALDAAGLFRTYPVAGAGRVVCYDPRHHFTLALLPLPKVAALVDELRREYVTLGARPEIRYVHMFENKGKLSGVSNPHPHCQIYGANAVFPLILRELEACREYRDRTGGNLVRDLAREEARQGDRVVFDNAFATAYVPFAARLPYEVHIVPKAPLPSLAAFGPAEVEGLAASIREMAVRYDNLYRMSFPYVMVFHQAPVDGADYSHYQFHVEFLPLLRNPGAQKFLAGPELGGDMMINPKSPEAAARELAGAGTAHFRGEE